MGSIGQLYKPTPAVSFNHIQIICKLHL